MEILNYESIEQASKELAAKILELILPKLGHELEVSIAVNALHLALIAAKNVLSTQKTVKTLYLLNVVVDELQRCGE